jgi:hypothetical protein
MKEWISIKHILFYNAYMPEAINTVFDHSDYRGTLLHYAAADCTKSAILTLLHRDADIMLEDSLHLMPIEVATDKNNSKFLNFCKSICS